MARSKNGEAIGPHRRTPAERRWLKILYWEAKRVGDLETWRRAKAVSGYLAGKKVIALSDELDVTRGAINRWLQWFNALGADGLRTGKAPGPPPRLNKEQREEVISTIEAGPQAAGFTTGIWTGPMVGDWIRRRFGVSYHNHYVPVLLHQLGFSVQRPRKRLANANAEAQAAWIHERFPAIKKKLPRVGASSSLKTKPASGSTARSIRRGRGSVYSHGSTPSGSGRLHTSSGR